MPAFLEYAVRWDEDEAGITVDGDHIRTCAHPPTYPLQVMIAVFDFPEWSRGDDDGLVAAYELDRVRGSD